MTDFGDVLESLEGGEGTWRGQVSADWMQGRTCFGGLLGALGLRALRKDASIVVPLVSIDVAFVAPVPPGERAFQAPTRSGPWPSGRLPKSISKRSSTGCTSTINAARHAAGHAPLGDAERYREASIILSNAILRGERTRALRLYSSIVSEGGAGRSVDSDRCRS